ncbi:hypothetical protein FOMA001_g13322 [Fusarium oxysporum f. sp. matthiolae]|nr:hypothetical protein FOMA001_g13322 [Fusarium oxysporum f. sp. matthiolae]
MHPSQRAAGANNPRRRHDTTHTRTALVQGRALMLASYIKDIFLEGELLGEGVEPRWALGGKETQMIAFDKWVTFQTLFMDGWTGFLERISVQGDTFWTDHQPAFHAYDYGANINIEVNEGIANLEEETVIRPAYLDGLDDEDDESGDGYEEENSSLLATQQGWGQVGGEEQEGDVDELYNDVASQIPLNLGPGCTDADHRDVDDEADANGHHDDDDDDDNNNNNGDDDERERRFLEWMNESENTDVGQHNGTQLEDQEHQDDGQANSQQQPLSPDTGGSDDVHSRQAPDAPPSSLSRSSASAPATEDQREHDALYSPGLMRLREALEAKYNLDNISHVSYALAVDVHSSHGLATAALTIPSTEAQRTARLKDRQQRLLVQVRGRLTPDNPGASTPFARERQRVEAAMQANEFAFRFEQVISIDAPRLVRRRRNFSSVLQPIFQLMRLFLKEKQLFAGILRRFSPDIFPGVMVAFAKVMEAAIAEMDRRFRETGSKGLGMALSDSPRASLLLIDWAIFASPGTRGCCLPRS